MEYLKYHIVECFRHVLGEARDIARAGGFVVGELVKGLLEYSDMWPIIMFLIEGVPAGMAWIQGKVARGLTRLYGERAFISRISIIAVTRVGLFVTSLV
jgi:hypothetical protein